MPYVRLCVGGSGSEGDRLEQVSIHGNTVGFLTIRLELCSWSVGYHISFWLNEFILDTVS